ncbi:MAG TPA: sarcosine oxidase subunit delta [Steroidobacteraceae bacterium]|nr:sarcosine oxidase subunit delta [Steroidobacteraceae bacterium]
MLIRCPFCGERDAAEFQFRITVPDVEGTAAERLYLRRADPHRSIEHWQHLGGCQMWLELTRDLTSGAVLAVSAELTRERGPGPAEQ